MLTRIDEPPAGARPTQMTLKSKRKSPASRNGETGLFRVQACSEHAGGNAPHKPFSVASSAGRVEGPWREIAFQTSEFLTTPASK